VTDPRPSIESQIALLDQIEQYPDGRPKSEDVHTTGVLGLSAAERPKHAAPGV
jgi:NitT/TauT family transport system substrate-binding protein